MTLIKVVLVWAGLVWTGCGFAQFSNLEGQTSQTQCEAKCSTVDADALFPQGVRNASCVARCQGVSGNQPSSPGVRPTGNNRAFILLEPMIYRIGNSNIDVIVPAGFVTDYASVPSGLWSLYSPHDQYSRAAIVHDYLYWTQICSKPQADNIFLIAMKESEVPEATRQAVYAGVASEGKSSWEKNRDARLKGVPRIIPVNRKDFPPNWSWEHYRIKLVAEGYRDPNLADSGAYCAFGNSQAVPGGVAKADKVPLPVTVVRALLGLF